MADGGLVVAGWLWLAVAVAGWLWLPGWCSLVLGPKLGLRLRQAASERASQQVAAWPERASDEL
jgi:hypothetical protein